MKSNLGKNQPFTQFKMGNPDATILIVDDDENHRELVVLLLSNAGYHVLTACNGADALDILGRNDVDLVLTDVAMPVMDGVTTAWKIQLGAVPNCPNDMPVVAVTAFAMPGERERFIEYGFTDYITKPFRGEEVLEKVREILRGEPSAPPT